MHEELKRFLRDSHVFARLVEQVLEAGYLRSAVQDSVTFDQLNVLKFLARPGSVPLVKDVARFLNASYAAASKAVGRLRKKGLAKTTRSSEDGRAELVEVTPLGAALVRKYERLKARRLEALLAGEDLPRISEALERAIALLLRERAVAGDPCMGCGAYYSDRCVVRTHGFPCDCKAAMPVPRSR